MLKHLDRLPSHVVENMRRDRDRVRRLQMREEKLMQTQRVADTKIQKALERATFTPKKLTGRQPLSRSEPPRTHRKTQDQAQLAAEQAEHDYYFK